MGSVSRTFLVDRVRLRRLCRSRTRADGARLVVAMEDVDDGAAYHARHRGGVHLHRQREVTDIAIVLHELNLLDEERWRLHQRAFGATQRPRHRVKVNPAFEEARYLAARLG